MLDDGSTVRCGSDTSPRIQRLRGVGRIIRLLEIVLRLALRRSDVVCEQPHLQLAKRRLEPVQQRQLPARANDQHKNFLLMKGAMYAKRRQGGKRDRPAFRLYPERDTDRRSMARVFQNS